MDERRDRPGRFRGEPSAGDQPDPGRGTFWAEDRKGSPRTSRTRRRRSFQAAATVGALVTATLSWALMTVSAGADDVIREFPAAADTTVSQVPQDGDGAARTTLATCPSLCDKNPRGRRVALLDFVVRGLPLDAVVTSARLEVTTWSAFDASVSAHSATVTAQQYVGGISLGLSPSPVDRRPSLEQGANSWDVTSLVRSNGRVTVALNQSTLGTRVYWASAENAATARRPRLIVEYRHRVEKTPPATRTSAMPSATSTPTSRTPAPPRRTAEPTPSPSRTPTRTPTRSVAPTASSAPSPTPTPAPPAPAGWRLVWSDNFDGTSLDTKKWRARDNTWLDYDEACITNRPENVQVSGGHLVLRARRENYRCGSQNRSYTDAYLDTIGLAKFTYGRFEIRAQSPGNQSGSTGLWPAFWLRPDDGGNGEIDVVELPGGSAYYKASTASIFRDYTPVKQDYRYAFPTGHPGDGFHTYTTEWDKNYLKWYVDGVLVYQRNTSTTPWFAEVFRKPYHLRLNYQVGGKFPGSPNATTKFPSDFAVDYVRVWQR
jgi:beta-glucanase (GH16 family)